MALCVLCKPPPRHAEGGRGPCTDLPGAREGTGSPLPLRKKKAGACRRQGRGLHPAAPFVPVHKKGIHGRRSRSFCRTVCICLLPLIQPARFAAKVRDAPAGDGAFGSLLRCATLFFPGIGPCKRCGEIFQPHLSAASPEASRPCHFSFPGLNNRAIHDRRGAIGSLSGPPRRGRQQEGEEGMGILPKGQADGKADPGRRKRCDG